MGERPFTNLWGGYCKVPGRQRVVTLARKTEPPWKGRTEEAYREAAWGSEMT